ncbi:uncharacterized protein Z519_01455 [Cladophialophora bantiana CBS 173.52]|uniref:BZIP domain-containing protein n=1 Tax=Cladophialophora bantiana (strain ATCC 10958 / CBS 173.52 / CDC B-1940 / NIH 8579) TaxID=1442370 RepID=A0A0D2F6V6_CLAB1|nr:uncharacterized protein Z519_01455 [Cladophialophora bantiana CBS 173.52]KIW97871.1 hypothetical protein Z519_01455 [Cladophialophora bantiana CBS 173.52]
MDEIALTFWGRPIESIRSDRRPSQLPCLRTVQSQYYDCLVGDDDSSSALGWDNVDVSGECIGDACRDQDTYRILEEATHRMGDGSSQAGDAASPGDDPVEAFGNVTLSFPESFFANPFAVSFPGDIPCPGAPASQFIPECTSEPAPNSGNSGTEASPMTPDTGLCTISDFSNSIKSPKSTLCTPLNSGETTRPVSKGPLGPKTKYGPQIHFVDMADKKGAQRIRNTMNSRKHRQNKLDKIRELEKKLATIEAERERWQGRATEMGWKPSQ